MTLIEFVVKELESVIRFQARNLVPEAVKCINRIDGKILFEDKVYSYSLEVKESNE